MTGLALLGACGTRSQGPPAPGHDAGQLPDLRGTRVMVLPVQLREGGYAHVDGELRFALGEVGAGVEWLLPGGLRETLERSPGVEVALNRLAIQPFLAGEPERVGDPLFGELYRLGALTDAEYALLPVAARGRREGADETVELTAALLEVRTGRVLWLGVVVGAPGPPGSPGPAASAAEALVRRISP